MVADNEGGEGVSLGGANSIKSSLHRIQVLSFFTFSLSLFFLILFQFKRKLSAEKK